jgi:acetyl esterase
MSPPANDSVPIVLDNGHRQFLAALATARLAGSVSLAELRAAAIAARRPWQNGGARMDEIVEHRIGDERSSVRARIYFPTDNRPPPALIYLHGGGWTLLDIGTHDRIMREYAAWSGWAVVGLEFPSAPETPFPGALQTCLTAIASLDADPSGYGLQRRFALAGDSSGANLAVAAATALRDIGRATVSALILNYGVYDHDLTRRSYLAYGSPPFTLSADRMAWFWDNYCPDLKDRQNPLASPLYADLTRLPPIRLVTAGQDVLRDENLAMAVRLAEAGNAVSVDHYPHAPHAFLEALALNSMATRAIRKAAGWLNDLFAGETIADGRQ